MKDYSGFYSTVVIFLSVGLCVTISYMGGIIFPDVDKIDEYVMFTILLYAIATTRYEVHKIYKK